VLITKKELEKIDSEKMFDIYDQWPELATESFNNQDRFEIEIPINHIVFAGMGGSGALGDIFAAILSKTSIHVTVVKGYHLPTTVNENTLIVTTSISGNTDETLNVLDEACKNNHKIIAFCSGGKMEKYCKENNLQFRKIPQIHSPRASFISFLFAMIKNLECIIQIKKEDVFESIEKLKELREKISSNNLNNNNPSLDLANSITKIPLIYYPWGLQSAAIRFKNCLQENSKLHAISEDVIEACHNGVVAWSRPSNIQPILLRGQDDFLKTSERYDILKEFFQTNKIDFIEIYSVKGSILSKLINLIYLLDYATIYRSVIMKIDPSPVKAIDFIKKELD